MPGIQWTPNEFQDCLFDPVNINVNYCDFLTDILSLGLAQISNFKNRAGNVLDVIFTNVISDFKLEKALLTLTRKQSIHHEILSLTYYFNDDIRNKVIENKVFYDFDNADYDKISYELNKLNINSNDLNYAVDSLQFCLKFVPKRVTVSLTCPAHFDKCLRYLRNKRNKAFKKYKRTNKQSDYNDFLKLREIFEKEEQVVLKLHREKIALRMIDEPKRFWDFIK